MILWGLHHSPPLALAPWPPDSDPISTSSSFCKSTSLHVKLWWRWTSSESLSSDSSASFFTDIGLGGFFLLKGSHLYLILCFFWDRYVKSALGIMFNTEDWLSGSDWFTTWNRFHFPWARLRGPRKTCFVFLNARPPAMLAWAPIAPPPIPASTPTVSPFCTVRRAAVRCSALLRNA